MKKSTYTLPSEEIITGFEKGGVFIGLVNKSRKVWMFIHVATGKILTAKVYPTQDKVKQALEHLTQNLNWDVPESEIQANREDYIQALRGL